MQNRAGLARISSMISNEQLREFGFEDISKFPQILTDHAVTISLPSAIAHQLEPVQVIINRGLAIPVQMPGVPNGMIIRSDGKMVYVGHESAADFSTPLKASFTDNINYDVRLEAFNIMSRAVEVDPLLGDIWIEILSHWVKWYPILLHEIKRQHAGEFNTAKEAVAGLEDFLESFARQVEGEQVNSDIVPFKIVVQTVEEVAKGWQGEEFVADESTVGAVLAQQVHNYMKQRLLPKLRLILESPIFFTKSTFRLYFEPRVVPVLKMLVIPPLNGEVPDLPRGIDL